MSTSTWATAVVAAGVIGTIVSGVGLPAAAAGPEPVDHWQDPPYRIKVAFEGPGNVFQHRSVHVEIIDSMAGQKIPSQTEECRFLMLPGGARPGDTVVDEQVRMRPYDVLGAQGELYFRLDSEGTYRVTVTCDSGSSYAFDQGFTY